MKGPNPVSVGVAVLQALRAEPPRPQAGAPAQPPDHSPLVPILEAVEGRGVAGLPPLLPALESYISEITTIDPDELDHSHSLAYWMNLYNAGALRLAGEAFSQNQESVLRTPKAFTRPLASIAGQRLTLTQVEHGKIRRFGDPRIHGALVCGSVSCPTLRYEPYDGADLDAQLDEQMAHFLSAGGAYVHGDKLLLSRVFLWYGADFVRPHRMPALLPVRKARVARALQAWMDQDLIDRFSKLRVSFQPYDWSLACSVG